VYSMYCNVLLPGHIVNLHLDVPEYHGQGLTLVHFSAQLEPVLTQDTPHTPSSTP